MKNNKSQSVHIDLAALFLVAAVRCVGPEQIQTLEPEIVVQAQKIAQAWISGHSRNALDAEIILSLSDMFGRELCDQAALEVRNEIPSDSRLLSTACHYIDSAPNLSLFLFGCCSTHLH